MIPLVVNTCQKYAPVWNVWYHFTMKYLSGYGDIYFMTDFGTPDFASEVKVIKTGETEWGAHTIKGLSRIDSELIYYTLEDFWAFEPFNVAPCEVPFIHFDMTAMRICAGLKYHTLDHVVNAVYRFTTDSKYLCSHQFSLLKRQWFLDNILPFENPWENEINGTERIRAKYKDDIYQYVYPWYVHACRGGQLTKEGSELLQREGL